MKIQINNTTFIVGSEHIQVIHTCKEKEEDPPIVKLFSFKIIDVLECLNEIIDNKKNKI